jgi:hypothetical protein
MKIEPSLETQPKLDLGWERESGVLDSLYVLKLNS